MRLAVPERVDEVLVDSSTFAERGAVDLFWTLRERGTGLIGVEEALRASEATVEAVSWEEGEKVLFGPVERSSVDFDVARDRATLVSVGLMNEGAILDGE